MSLLALVGEQVFGAIAEVPTTAEGHVTPSGHHVIASMDGYVKTTGNDGEQHHE